MTSVAIGGGLLVLVGVAFAVAAFAFWIWVLIDCLTKEPSEGNEKIIWVLVIVFLQAIGALIYFLIRRPQRMTLHGR